MKIGVHEVELVAPARLSHRIAVMGAAAPGREHAALAAALGLCWPRLARQLPYRGDPLAYGEQVIDHLCDPELCRQRGDKPISIPDVLRAGRAAYDLCVESLPMVEQGVADFAPPRADTTGAGSRGGSTGANSTSSEPGANTLDGLASNLPT